MISINGVGLVDVQEVYSGPIWAMWELLMGEQVHIGGLGSSTDLADRAGIAAGSRGVDFCCCTGAGMRFLMLVRGVASMTGIDATEKVVESGRARCKAAGLDGRAQFIHGDVTQRHLPAESFDFAWGEDAWCYVVDKRRLVEEASRVVKSGGKVAFTDWVVGPGGLTSGEAERFMGFMKFPNLEEIGGYAKLLESAGCEVVVAEDTGRFAPCLELYVDMVMKQHGYDALRILGFDQDMMGMLGSEMLFTRDLARAKKIVQGIFVAQKK